MSEDEIEFEDKTIKTNMFKYMDKDRGKLSKKTLNLKLKYNFNNIH